MELPYSVRRATDILGLRKTEEWRVHAAPPAQNREVLHPRGLNFFSFLISLLDDSYIRIPTVLIRGPGLSSRLRGAINSTNKSGCKATTLLWCRARPIKGPGLSRLRGVFTPPTSMAVRPYTLPLNTISPLGGGWCSHRCIRAGSSTRDSEPDDGSTRPRSY